MSQIAVLTTQLTAVDRFQEALLCDRSQLGLVRAIRRARRRRSEFLPSKLCSDPAWGMLLELYVAQLEQRRISITAVSRGAGVAETTGLRWLDAFAREGLISKRCDPLNARRVWVSLSASGMEAMRAYFASEANGSHVIAWRPLEL
jgi:DNA-binding MarR family transcriptional regulator